MQAIRTAAHWVAYLGRDGRTVTTWTGATLGTVTSLTTSGARWSRYGPVHRRYVRVTDIHGAHWYGSGPVENGDYLRLHRAKVPA